MKIFCYFLLCLIPMMFSCGTKTLKEGELVLINGRYCEKKEGRPFSGKVLYTFSDGEGISGENGFEKGIPQYAKSFGYADEIVIESIFSDFNVKEALNNIGIERTVLIRSTEGFAPRDVLAIIINSDFKEVRYEQVCDQLFRNLESMGCFNSNVAGAGVVRNGFKIIIVEGEFERPIFEKKY